MNTKIIEKLRKLKPILKERYGIEEFAVFGSVARGENNKDSDVDIVIIKMKQKDYFILIDSKRFLEKNLDKKVDIGFYSSMRPIIKKYIEKELIHV